MLGSLVYVGGLPLEEALDTPAIDGPRLGDELTRIGYAGSMPCPGEAPHAFVELHIEQGPMLEANAVRIGSVTGVQGISWQEVTITGQSNHAGTTPMNMRRDALATGAELILAVEDMAKHYPGDPVATVGALQVWPNAINIVPGRVEMSLDMRDLSQEVINHMLAQLKRKIETIAVSTRTKIRIKPELQVEPTLRLLCIVAAHAVLG